MWFIVSPRLHLHSQFPALSHSWGCVTPNNDHLYERNNNLCINISGLPVTYNQCVVVLKRWDNFGCHFIISNYVTQNFSADIILFVSSKQRSSVTWKFAVIFIFIPFTTYEKISFTEWGDRSFTNGFSGPKGLRDFRETGPWTWNRYIYKQHENDKKRLYTQRVINVEQGTFTPLVFTTTGGMGEKCKSCHNKLVELVAAKRRGLCHHCLVDTSLTLLCHP